jgi:isopenicillin N synthase-like dioxygenase
MSGKILKKYTSQTLKPIILDYGVLSDTAIDLSKEIECSFGRNGNGIILINNIPNYVTYKNTLLPLAKKVHNLPQEIKKKYERPEIYYGIGICTYEKYHFKGVKDMATSWYCSSTKDKIESVKFIKDGKEIIEKYPDNFWPTEDLPELEPAFKNLGKLTYEVGFTLGKHIDQWVKSLNPNYQIGRINRTLTRPVGRLVHYHTSVEFEENNKDQAVYWHSDTSSITSLCSPIYMDQDGNVVEGMSDEAGHGLEILKRDGTINSCCIPPDCLAIQIGEVMQILSGGKLEATPHRVVATKYPTYTREQFVNFFLPQFDEIMSIPEGATEEDVFNIQSDKVPDLRVRWRNGESFKVLLDESWKFFI